MILESLVVGQIATNCFILGCEKEKIAVVIDPGGNAEGIMDKLKQHELEMKAIIATHAHFDHIAAVAPLVQKTGAKLYMHKDDWSILERASKSAAAWGFQVEQRPPT